MTLDIRATVTCNLGPLIQGSISDSYVQNSGLIQTSGTVTLSGLFVPAIGTAVTISYAKAGVTRTIPRRLRVLSSFADPLRRTTAIEMGCKLTYLQDLQQKIDWTAFKDPSTTMTEGDAEIVTVPIRAQAVAQKCLTELGITASGLALTNNFSTAKYDFSPGYVSVLSDLLLSESVCGYLDSSEVLKVFNLASPGGTGPVIDASQIIDINKIGAGQLPGEAVTVSYSTLRLKQPDPVPANRPDSPWEKTKNQSEYNVNISYTITVDNGGGPQQVAAIYTHPVIETTITETEYTTITNSQGDQLRLPSRRSTTLTTSTAAIIGNIYASYLSNGVKVAPYQVDKYTTEVFSYDTEGNETSHEKRVHGSVVFLLSDLSVPWVLDDGSLVTIPAGEYGIDGEDRFTATVGNKKQVTINTYGPWHKTIAGQLAGSNARDSITTAAEAAEYINAMLEGGLSLIDSRTETLSTDTPISAPTKADINNAKYAKGGNPANGYRVDAKSSVLLAMGSATAQRRIELTMPKAPDDVFFSSGGGVYGSAASSAQQKAQLFGITQNRILLGNRNGVSLQTLPEVLPAPPFSPFVVRSGNASAMYRTNGTTWTFDAQGVVASCDALFWGAVGGTGSPWFPVAPGVTLPAEPSTTTVTINDSGGNPVHTYQQMTVAAAIPAYNQTTLLVGSLKVRSTIKAYDYIFNEILQLTPTLTIGATITLYSPITIPAATVTVAALAPMLPRPEIRIPAATIAVAALAPTVGGRKALVVPTATISAAAIAPALPRTILNLGPVFYWDPSNSSTVTLSGSEIQSITDQGSRGWTLTKSATGPQIYTDGSSRRWIDWGTGGHNNYLRNTTSTDTAIAEWYIVVDANYGSTFATYNGLVTATVDDTNPNEWFVTGYQGLAGFDSAGSQFDAAYLNGSATNSYASVLPTINSPTLLRIKKLNDTAATLQSGVQLGNDRNNPNRGWGGLMGAVVGFASPLSAADRAAIQEILANAWGITLV